MQTNFHYMCSSWIIIATSSSMKREAKKILNCMLCRSKLEKNDHNYTGQNDADVFSLLVLACSDPRRDTRYVQTKKFPQKILTVAPIIFVYFCTILLYNLHKLKNNKQANKRQHDSLFPKA